MGDGGGGGLLLVHRSHSRAKTSRKLQSNRRRRRKKERRGFVGYVFLLKGLKALYKDNKPEDKNKTAQHNIQMIRIGTIRDDENMIGAVDEIMLNRN